MTESDRKTDRQNFNYKDCAKQCMVKIDIENRVVQIMINLQKIVGLNFCSIKIKLNFLPS